MKHRSWKHAALAATSVLLGSLVARAYDTTWIAAGQPLSAAKLKADLDDVQTRLAALESGRTATPLTTGANIASAYIQNNGTAATIGRQDGQWLATPARTAPGIVQVNFAPSYFSAAPICVASSDYFTEQIVSSSAASVTVEVAGTNGGGVDRNFYIVCIGPK